MSNPKNEPAFPCPMGGDWPECDRGMTLRDYFAAKALQGLLAKGGEWNPLTDLACDAYSIADAMLKARES